MWGLNLKPLNLKAQKPLDAEVEGLNPIAPLDPISILH